RSRWPSGSGSCSRAAARRRTEGPPSSSPPRPPPPRRVRRRAASPLRAPVRRAARPGEPPSPGTDHPTTPTIHTRGRPTMANFTAADVKRLRDLTGAGMLDCKKALEEAEGEFDRAVEVLRIKGAAKAAKRG